MTSTWQSCPGVFADRRCLLPSGEAGTDDGSRPRTPVRPVNPAGAHSRARNTSGTHRSHRATRSAPRGSRSGGRGGPPPPRAGAGSSTGSPTSAIRTSERRKFLTSFAAVAMVGTTRSLGDSGLKVGGDPRGRLFGQSQMQPIQHKLLFGFRFGVTAQDQGSPVGGRQMHVDHLDGGEFLQGGPRGQSRATGRRRALRVTWRR